MPTPIITLTTDFGISDWFVGTMKGVMLGHAPNANIVDVTHGIPRGDIRAGAFALAAATPYFPKGTLHVVVVDPEVGTDRRAIVVQTDHATFIAPDNGVVSLAVGHHAIRTIRRIENRKYWLNPLSRTFHGRDVFASVAGFLAAGSSMAAIGPRMGDFEQIHLPVAVEEKRGMVGEVLFVDHFGNAITNIAEGGETEGSIYLRGRRLCAVGPSYASVPEGRPVGVFGSSGYLELAVNGGSAAARFKLKAGTRVDFRW